MSQLASLAIPAPKRFRGPNQLCHILLNNGDVTSANVRKALRIQEEHGGQIGRILVALGACSERAISRALVDQVRLRKDEDANVPNASALARSNPALAGLVVECSPAKTLLVLLAADAFALTMSFVLAFSLQFTRDFTAYREAFYLLIAATSLCGAAYAALGLYSAAANSTPDELRNATTGTTISLIGVTAVALFGDRATRGWTFLSLTAWWFFTVTILPLARAYVRHRFANRAWYGHPVVVLGAAKTGRLLVRTLRSQPHRGLKPVLLLDDDAGKHGTLRASVNTTDGVEVRSLSMMASDLVQRRILSSVRAYIMGDTDAHPPSTRMSLPPPSDANGRRSSYPPPVHESGPISLPPPVAPGMFAEVEGVPLVGDLTLAPLLAKRLKIKYAILAMPGVESSQLLRITERLGSTFSHILVIPDLFGLGSIGVPAKDIGGVLGIEVRQQLILRGPRTVKRIIDLVLTIFGGIAILPIIATLAALIALDSRGGVFYNQKRLGRDGRTFKAYKFRTMHGDGESRLQAVLDSDPALKEEYAKFHKLRNDPRVTRIGRVLRKYSLDELPQLWNVLRGEMSLVGPRPYIEREVKDMEGQEGMILRATPGMTGLWQVSDRNAIGFAGRVKMDVHYVRNWSPWIDIYILTKTFNVVAKGTGM
jgi:lipopolysaccharide/colanic/teichoic acid biosynthesis glycosyltransferase